MNAAVRTPSAPSRASSALAVALSLLGCGARTDLAIEELDAAAAFDAAVDAQGPTDAGRDAEMRVDACMPVTVPLTPVRAELMLVLDRSTSMGWALEGPDAGGPSRWSLLVDTLRAELPRYDATSDLGLLFFPEVGGDFCSVAPAPQLAPAEARSMAVLGLLMRTSPEGRTPTAEGLRAAERYFARALDAGRPRAVVLATDGAPNCNASLDPRRCPCTGGAGLPSGRCTEPELCLDDSRTLDAIAGLSAMGVPTYVIGIDGDPDPAVAAVLRRLAFEGGRPNPVDPDRGFYSVRRPEDLSAAFSTIEASIPRCTYAPERTVPREGAALELDGERVVEGDPDGWAWTESEPPFVELRGEACERVRAGEHTLVLDLGCAP